MPRPRGPVLLHGPYHPPAVRKGLGFALYKAQFGQQHESAKMLRGFSETVWQVRADDPSGTYRAVYVAQFANAI